MRILVCNDDGISAPGLERLWQAAQHLSKDIWIVAPDGKRTAGSHALTIGCELRLTRVAEQRYACSGTPADCAATALTYLLRENLPDLVLSGVNDGRNVGEDLIYSGTNAIAREATFWGIPAIAISQAKGSEPGRTDPQWLTALIDTLWRRKADWASDSHWLSINLPTGTPKGIREAVVGRDKIAINCDVLEERGAVVRLSVARARQNTSKPGDENAVLRDGFASIIRPCWFGATPIPRPLAQDLSEFKG